VLGVLLALAVAAASRVFVERPFLRLKSRLQHDQATPQPTVGIVENGPTPEPAPG